MVVKKSDWSICECDRQQISRIFFSTVIDIKRFLWALFKKDVKSHLVSSITYDFFFFFLKVKKKPKINTECILLLFFRMLVSQHDRQCEDVLSLTKNTEKRGCCTWTWHEGHLHQKHSHYTIHPMPYMYICNPSNKYMCIFLLNAPSFYLKLFQNI